MPLNVLYLDDEPELCELFAEEFTSEYIQITALSDVTQAIDIANSSWPQLIFLDYRLPGTTGDKIARKMPDGIPKLLVTGDIAVQTDYKFDHVLRKPTDPHEITAVLTAYLAGRLKTDRATE